MYAGAVLLLLPSLLVARDYPLLGILLCIAFAGLCALMAFGAERVAIVLLVLAFATAPAYRGLDRLSGGVATPTDIFLILAVGLLLPGVITRQLTLPPPYVISVAVIAFLGLVASTLAASTLGSIFTLLQWLFFLAGLPVVIAWWRPSVKVVVTLLWAYVAGQMISLLFGLADGPTVGDRYQGLSHHINAFGMAGMTSMAILLYLFHHHRGGQARVIVLGAAAASAASVVMSGSRAALVVAVVLVLMVPVVERSAISGFVLGVFGAGGLIAFPLLVQTGHGGSALARLAGDQTARVADQARGLGLDEGFRRLHESPVLGQGLGDVEVIHNVFLEVAVGIGVIGLGAYLVTLFVLSRPLVTDHPHRRLCYLPVAFIGMGPALPSIFDRTMWVPISLCILTVIDGWPGGKAVEDEAAAESTAPPPTPRLAPIGPRS